MESLDPDRIIIDTNIAIYVAKGNEYGRRYGRVLVGRRVAVAFATLGELFLNARKTQSPNRTEAYWRQELEHWAVLPPDTEVCAIWAQLCARALAAGRRPDANDMWIAACALRWDLPLVTHNLAHFEDIPGLRIIHHPDA